MSSPLILVVEDERDIRQLIVLTLQLSGFRVVEAPNGEEAVKQALEVNPDLILMDVRMPKMDGYEACQRLKQMEQTQDIPVVFLSAKGQETQIKRGYDVGAVAYFLKPFTPEELPPRLNRILKEHGRPRK
jgi:CheY-like chemotaxis protein